jgi:uncharacterized membrane protein
MTLRFIGLTTLTLQDALLCAQFGIMLALLLGLFLGHRLKGLLFALLLASFIFGTLLSNSTTTSIENSGVSECRRWQRDF